MPYLAPLPFASEQVQVEMVNAAGERVGERTINMQDLLQSGPAGIDIGNGFVAHAEEDSIRDDVSTETISSAGSTSTEEGGPGKVSSVHPPVVSPPPPPGTQGVNQWYGVLQALDQGENRPPSLAPSVPHATPMQPFAYARPSSTQEAAQEEQQKAPIPRQSVWAALAPPTDPERNYHHLEYVSVMRCITTRHFRPSSLSCQAMTTYLHPKDLTQRILVYGGIGAGGRSIEQEMYEFSLISQRWKRVEGKNFVPAGHFGHTMTVIPALHRAVVVGGFGPGGIDTDLAAVGQDPLRQARFDAFFTHMVLQDQSSVLRAPSLTRCKSRVGFVPFVFDMGLEHLEWRAVQIPHPLTLAFHTAVAYGKMLFIFGGITAHGEVGGQLIAMDAETFAVRLVAAADSSPNATALSMEASVCPAPRYGHTAAPYGPYMIIHGGFDAQNEPLGDTWAFDMVHERWERLNTTVSEKSTLTPTVARGGHSAVVVGNRLLIIGGYNVSLEQCGEVSPIGSIAELSLTPTPGDEHRWRTVRSRPTLPKLAFSGACSCGDHLSFLLFGGLVLHSIKAGDQSRSASRGRSVPTVGGQDVASSAPQEISAGKALATRMATLDDAIVVSFPLKQREAPEEVGGESDLQVPEWFRPFVKRQEDFVKKKYFSVEEARRRVTLEEKESMEPTFYLKPEEIELLLSKSEELCLAIAAYNGHELLPHTVPDRDERIKILENVTALSRQTRDVIRSMKGSEAGITAVKSKTHRKRGGQKFEDYSAAKPFRRFVVSMYLKELHDQLQEMTKLNKSLKEVAWDEKEVFIKAIKDMGLAQEHLVRVIDHMMNQYLQSSVDKLMKGVDKHKDVMKKLSEIVRQNEHDKIWGVQQARDQTRGNSSTRPRSRLRPFSVADAPPPLPRSRSKPRALYFEESSSATVRLNKNEWNTFQDFLSKAQESAYELKSHCKRGMKGVETEGETALPGSSSLTAPYEPEAPGSPAPPPVSSPVTAAGLITSGPGGELGSLFTASPPPPVAPPTQPLLLTPPALPGNPVSPAPPPVVHVDQSNPVDPHAVVIRRSNELRKQVAKFAGNVQRELYELSSKLGCAYGESESFSSTYFSDSRSGSDSSDSPSTSNPVGPTTLATPAPAVTAAKENHLPAAGVEKNADGCEIPLRFLKELMKEKDLLPNTVKVAARIRKNEWDKQSLTGAPQDEEALKLSRRLQRHLSGLTQIISSTFLCSQGAKPAPEVKRSTSSTPHVQRWNACGQSGARPAPLPVSTPSSPATGRMTRRCRGVKAKTADPVKAADEAPKIPAPADPQPAEEKVPSPLPRMAPVANATGPVGRLAEAPPMEPSRPVLSQAAPVVSTETAVADSGMVTLASTSAGAAEIVSIAVPTAPIPVFPAPSLVSAGGVSTPALPVEAVVPEVGTATVPYATPASGVLVAAPLSIVAAGFSPIIPQPTLVSPPVPSTVTSFMPGHFALQYGSSAGQKEEGNQDGTAQAAPASNIDGVSAVDEDYFYFSQSPPVSGKLSVPNVEKPESLVTGEGFDAIPLVPAQATASARKKQPAVASVTLAPSHISPPVSSAVLHSSESRPKRTASARRGSRGRSSGRGYNAPTATRTAAAAPKVVRSNLTPGEQRILEARERLRRK